MRLTDRILEEVQNIAPLRRAALSPSIFKEYELRTLEIVAFLKVDNPLAITFAQLDKSLCEFGIYLYDLNTRRDCLQHFRKTLFGTFFFLPELKPHLGRARQLERGWDRSMPSKAPHQFLWQP